MREAVLPRPVAKVDLPNEVFICPEESQFYTQCLENMLFKHCDVADTIVEFGAGDGSPVINALFKNDFGGIIHGFEINQPAYELACSTVKRHQFETQYMLHNQSFFDNLQLKANCLIANPPYLPAPDNDLYIPSLHGGIDGASVTKQLLALGYQNALLMISSYSNPISVVDYAAKQGYQLVDFMLLPLKFGYYSCEPKVKKAITELQNRHQAFYSENIYFLSGVLFRKKSKANADLSEEFIKVITSL